MSFWVSQSKDAAYVKNVVSWYRQQLDGALVERGLARSSSGRSRVDFEPDVSKTFNRGYTTYFAHGRGEPPGALESPKMVGERVGTIAAAQGNRLIIETPLALHSGDGLTWFDAQGELTGALVNAVEPRGGTVQVTVEEGSDIAPGTTIYRNRDHAFLRQVEQSRPVREMMARLRLETTPEGFCLEAVDEDGNRATAMLSTSKELARKPEQAEATARRQLTRAGDTPFDVVQVELDWDQPYFLPVSTLNELRRGVLARLLDARATNRPRLEGGIERNDALFPGKKLDYRGNVLNRQAEAFYRRHGVTEIEPAAESGLEMSGRVIMRSRYCIKHQLGLCDGTRRPSGLREPLFLVDAGGQCYRLHFDCAACKMEVIYL